VACNYCIETPEFVYMPWSVSCREYWDRHVSTLAYDHMIMANTEKTVDLGFTTVGTGNARLKESLGGVPYYFYDGSPFFVRLAKKIWHAVI